MRPLSNRAKKKHSHTIRAHRFEHEFARSHTLALAIYLAKHLSLFTLSLSLSLSVRQPVGCKTRESVSQLQPTCWLAEGLSPLPSAGTEGVSARPAWAKAKFAVASCFRRLRGRANLWGQTGRLSQWRLKEERRVVVRLVFLVLCATQRAIVLLSTLTVEQCKRLNRRRRSQHCRGASFIPTWLGWDPS